MSKESTHRVHIYATVRVAIDVAATSHEDAMQKALAFFDRDPETHIAMRGEYADEVTAFLVDEKGDEEYLKTKAYDAQMNPYGTWARVDGKPSVLPPEFEDEGVARTVLPEIFSGR